MSTSQEQFSLFGSNSQAEDKFAIDDLLRRSWDYRNSAEFFKFFDFIAKFQHYSRYNTMLVYLQNNAVTFFGGVSFWKKKFNRTISKDARPYIILAPKGPVMLVFDIFDTIGNLTPEDFLVKGLGRKPFQVYGKLKLNIFENALNEAKNWCINIMFKPLAYFHGGYVTTIFANKLDICLKLGFTNEQNFSILIHELAHLYLGHTGHKELIYKKQGKPYILPLRNISRSAEELEAEAVSYLICHKLGLISESSEYIAGYITCEKDLLDFSYETVIKTADRIEKYFVK